MKNQLKKHFLKTFLLLFVSFLTGNLQAQKGCPDWQWAITKTGGSSEEGTRIISDSLGNTYVTGWFKDSISLGSTTLQASGNNDIFIAKLNNTGQWQWAVKAGGTDFESGNDITIDISGNIYVTGAYSGTATFGSTTLQASGFGDVFIAKLNNNGQWQWAVKAGGTKRTIGYGITMDISGNIYVTGAYGGTATFGSTTLQASGLGDVFIAKLNNNGLWQWAVKAGGTWGTTGKSIAVDASGNIYVTGAFQNTVSFGTINFTAVGNNGPIRTTATDIFVAKLNNNGQWIWVVQVGNEYIDIGNDIKTDASGNLYITGNSGAANFGSIKTNDFGSFAAKLNSSGQWQWVINSNSMYSEGNSITIDKQGNTYFAGFFDSSLTIGNIVLKPKVWRDIFLAKINKNGQLEWLRSTGEDGTADFKSITNDENGNIYALGIFINSINLNGTILSPTGSQNMFVAKISDESNKILGDTSICIATLINQYKSKLKTKASYSWSVTGGSIQSGQNTDSISVLWNGVGNGTLKLVSTNASGCKDSTSLSVKIDSSACDWVWPGDANHDKIANSQDVLKIGLAYNDTGAARRNASSSWKVQYADNWTNSFQSGVNYKHADCNGDGIIDSADINVISNNYGQTWKKRGESQAPAGPNDANLVLEFTNDSLQPGDTAYVNIKLGTNIKPATNVYGLAFSFSFNPDLIESNTMKLNLSNSWLAAGGKGLISLTKEFNANGYADIAISKTDKKNKTGSGSIGTLSFVIKGQGINLKTLKTEIRDILAITNNEDTIPLNTFGDSLIVYQKSSAIQEFAASKNINIYPNPSKGNFILDLKDLYAQKIQVINMLGQVIWNTNNVQGKTEIQLNEVIAGLYYINIQTLNGVITKPVIINK